MEQAIQNAIKLLAEKITTSVKSDDALRYTQAALNLQHVLAVEANLRRDTADKWLKHLRPMEGMPSPALTCSIWGGTFYLTKETG